MKLTENFELKEFIESKFYNEEQQKRVWESFREDEYNLLPNIKILAQQLQKIRDYTQSPIIINIAYRPLWWEKMQGRDGKSQHVLGKAADITSPIYEPFQIHLAIEELISQKEILQGGLGQYNTFTHYDIRNRKARWDFRK